MTASKHEEALDALAAAFGVTRSYHDGTGTHRRACDEAVLAVLRALGAPVERVEDCEGLAGRVDPGRARAESPPVLVARLGDGVDLPFANPRRADGHVLLEGGARVDLERDAATGALRTPGHLPAGYHRVAADVDGHAFEATLMVSPARLPAAPRSRALFAPLYGIRHRDDAHPGEDRLGCYDDLARLGAWFAGADAQPRRGARDNRHRALVGTLPLLPCFLDEPCEPSPYSPISRCFWSELYVDFDAPALRAGSVPSRVDYRAAMRARRAAIEARLASSPGEARRTRRALAADGELRAWATFRAAVDHYRCTWESWPSAARSGRLVAGRDYDADVRLYHGYAQLLAREQFAAAAKASPAGLYLDLPLGSHGGGFDTWRHARSFANGIAVGAPPDGVFEGGQDWGFPPLHPERSRDDGHALWRAALRHHFEHAALLRVDHVMGLHRLFCIPRGFTPADGVYVRMPAEELWAVLSIEASRARGGAGAAVVGEDLGTVPDDVRAAMRSRGALRMHVVPFEYRTGHDAHLVPAPTDSLVCVGTHDMEPFAAWWEDAATPRHDLARALGCSADDTGTALDAALAWMAGSAATVACASLEDAWLERERQNQPGQPTGDANWQRPFAPAFEDFAGDEAVAARLSVLRAPGHDEDPR